MASRKRISGSNNNNGNGSTNNNRNGRGSSQYQNLTQTLNITLNSISNFVFQVSSIVKDAEAVLDKEKSEQEAAEAAKKAEEERARREIEQTAFEVQAAFSDLLDDFLDYFDGIYRAFYSAAQSFQKEIGSVLEEFQSFYESLADVVTELNTSLSYAFSTEDLLEIASTLASIGWSDLDSLTEVTESLAILNQTVSTLTSSFYKTVLRLGRILDNSLDDLLNIMADSITAYSEVFGVTASDLEDIVAEFESTLVLMAYDSTTGEIDTDLLAELNESLIAASALGISYGLTADEVEQILGTLTTQTYSEMGSDFINAMSLILQDTGYDLTDIVDMAMAGDFEEVMELIIEGMGNIYEDYLDSDGSVSQATKYIMSILENLSISEESVYKIIASVLTSSETIAEEMEEMADALEEAADSGGYAAEKASDAVLSISEIISNFLSSSALVTELAEILSDMGISSISDFSTVVTAISSVVTVVSGLASSGVITSLVSALPVVGIVIAALALFVEALEQSEELADSFSLVISTLIQVVSKVFETLSSLFSALADVVAAILEPAMDELAVVFDTLSTIFTVILNLLTPIISLISTIVSAFSALFDLLEPILTPIMYIIEAISDLISGVYNMIASAWNSIVDLLADISIFGWKPFSGLTKMETLGGNTIPYEETDTVYGFGATSEGIHTGTDIPMASSTPLATSDVGVVTKVSKDSTYGNYIEIQDSMGYGRLFAHLSEIFASKGDFLFPGETFGLSGSTGNSEQPHLHLETIDSGEYIDTAQAPIQNRMEEFMTLSNEKEGDQDERIESLEDSWAEYLDDKAELLLVVDAIHEMTDRLEKKLEEVSDQTDANTAWIAQFDSDKQEQARKITSIMI